MDENIIFLSQYRLEKADECIKASRLMLDNGLYADSANRSYYAIFHCARAVLALDGEDRKKHSGVIAYFREHYIKTGIFDKKYSSIIQMAFNIRQISDYQDFFIVSYADVARQAEEAQQFYNEVKEYIKKRTEQ